MRKTKIIATYGFSIDDDATLRKLAQNVNVFRINLAHGNKDLWLSWKGKIDDMAKKLGKEIATLADLPGPKIRIGRLSQPINIKKGEEVRLEYESKDESAAIPVNYSNLYRDARVGNFIVIGDGILKMKVTRISNKRIYCKSLSGGTITNLKGISLQGGSITAPVPTAEDFKLARFAKKTGFTYIGLSFTQHSRCVNKLRKALGDCFIIAKIETRDGLKNIDTIAEAADGIMVARGDLALDIPMEQLPAAQRQIIESARMHAKPVIVATQMLASMTKSIMPTRAEVSDIAGSVMEGVDCLMLSEETAAGGYPINAVEVLGRTIIETEKLIVHKHPEGMKADPKIRMAFAAADLANEYKVDKIFTPTITGATPKRLAALRPRSEIVALALSETVRKRLSMYYGVNAIGIERYKTTDKMFDTISRIAKKTGSRKYLVVFGSPNKVGSTDTIKYFG